MEANEIFTDEMTGAAFCEKNGAITIKETGSGKVFFTSVGSKAIYRSGYISDKAAKVLLPFIKDEVKNGAKPGAAIRKGIATLLDFAVIHFTDEEDEEQSCPTLMPKASGTVLFSADGWDD